MNIRMLYIGYLKAKKIFLHASVVVPVLFLCSQMTILTAHAGSTINNAMVNTQANVTANTAIGSHTNMTTNVGSIEAKNARIGTAIVNSKSGVVLNTAFSGKSDVNVGSIKVKNARVGGAMVNSKTGKVLILNNVRIDNPASALKGLVNGNNVNSIVIGK